MNRLTTRQKFRSLVLVTLGGFGAFSLISLYKGNKKFYKNYVIPVVHLLDPERAHRLAIFAGKYRLFPRSKFVDPDVLKTTLFGRELSNPIGIAAGFDKHGEAILGMQDVGVSFIEIGSVTPKPQAGNEEPRVFRLSLDKAVINRYGFNSDGHEIVFNRLEQLKSKNDLNVVLGVNLGKNKNSNEIEDYVEGIKKFSTVADYLVINVSSPNTPGLRDLQAEAKLRHLLKCVIKVRNEVASPDKLPVLLKLAPDLDDKEKKDIANVLKDRECRVDGLVVSNTTVNRPDSLQSKDKVEIGGLSGGPLKNLSTQMIADMYKLTGGMTIIGVGGISSGADAYEKIKAGAQAVQIYTAFVYEGPPVVEKVKAELAELLVRDNYKDVREAVGKDVL